MQELSYALSTLLALTSPSLSTDLSRLQDHPQALLYCEEIKYNYDILLKEIDQFAKTFRKNCYTIEENMQSVEMDNCKLRRQLQDGQHQHRTTIEDLQREIKELKYHLHAKEDKMRELHDKLEEQHERREENQRIERDILKKYQTHFQTQAAALQNSLLQMIEMERRLKQSHQECQRNIQINQINQHINDTLTQELQRTKYQLNQLWKTYQQKSEKEPSQYSPTSNKSVLLIGEIESIKKPLSPHNLKDILNEAGCTDNLYRKSMSSADKQNHSHNKEAKRSSEQWKIQSSPAFQMQEQMDPYYFTFIIIGQNAKIKSERFEEISGLDCNPFWKVIVEEKIPMHEWQHRIQQYLVKQL